MAKKYVITPDYNTIAAQVSAALSDFYGAGVTVHYTSTTSIVFSCAAISDKVIRLDLVSAEFDYYYGDAWTSGTTITNSVSVQTLSNGAAIANMYLILENNYLLFVDTNTSDAGILLIGKLSNDKFVFITTTNNSSASYYAARYGYITDTGNRAYFLPLGLDKEILHPSGYLLKFPIMFVDSSMKLILNTDGSPATMPNIFFTANLSSPVYMSSDVFVYVGQHFYNNSPTVGDFGSGILVELT